MVEGYLNLIDQLEGLRKDVALFRKVVLHSHSPDSHDYGKSILKDPSSTAYKDETQYRKALKNIDIHVLSITDHMKCGLACRIGQSTSLKNICILPGLEVSLRLPAPLGTNKLHLLVAIFPQNYSLEKINKIIPSNIPDEKDRNGHEVLEKDLRAFTEKVHECNGICIAAHIDSNNGIRKSFRQLGEDGIVFYAEDEKLTSKQERKISEQYKDWLLQSGIDAIEVSKATDLKHYRWINESKGRKVSVAAVLRGDAHRIEEIDIPERINYIKMTNTDINNLRRALEFPLTRIRFHNDVPDIPCPRILGIEIIGVEGGGFFDSLQLAFSDNLSCLIGPRGSGKSAIIEAIRYIFDLNKHFNDLEKAGKELAEKATSLQNATLADSIIRIAYIGKDRQTYILEATYDQKQDCTTRIFDINGDPILVQDIEREFPLRLFGWSEIETLGRETHRQRELLDQMIVGFSDDIQERKSIRFQVQSKKNDIDGSLVRLGEILDKDNGIIRKYKEYKAAFNKLNTKEIQVLFKDIDNIKVKISILQKLKANIDNYSNKIEQYQDTEFFQDIENIISSANDVDNIKLWWKEQESNFTTVESDIKKKITGILNALKHSSGQVQLKITSMDANLKEKEKKLREEIGEDDATTLLGAERRRVAKERLDKVEALRQEYFKRLKVFDRNISKWTALVESLTKISKNISDKRNQFKEKIERKLNKFSTEDMKISILFAEGQDKHDFIQGITDSGILRGDLHVHWRANKWPERIGWLYTPIEFALILLDRSKDYTKFDKRIKISGDEVIVDEDMAKTLIETLHPFEFDGDSDVLVVDKSKIDKILKLAEIEWDDYESILLNNKPVAKCSPGQRSSAMLPLIALVEDIPLIIDQPEDNLDNRLVGKMLVDILTGLKQNRQIIVSTHNPNIVVSGDAEQVIVLDAISDTKGKVVVNGSIDKEDIVSSVIEILEGGEEAFVNRSRRYHIEYNR